MTTVNPVRRIAIILMCIALFVLIMGMACDSTEGIHEAGQDVVNSVTFERTQAEQNVINMLQETCSQSAECAAHQLP